MPGKDTSSFLVPHSPTSPRAPLAGGQALQKPVFGVTHTGSASEGGCTGATENLTFFQGAPPQQAASLSEASTPSENLCLCDPGKPGKGLSAGTLTDGQHFHHPPGYFWVALLKHLREKQVGNEGWAMLTSSSAAADICETALSCHQSRKTPEGTWVIGLRAIRAIIEALRLWVSAPGCTYSPCPWQPCSGLQK